MQFVTGMAKRESRCRTQTLREPSTLGVPRAPPPPPAGRTAAPTPNGALIRRSLSKWPVLPGRLGRPRLTVHSPLEVKRPSRASPLGRTAVCGVFWGPALQQQASPAPGTSAVMPGSCLRIPRGEGREGTLPLTTSAKNSSEEK